MPQPALLVGSAAMLAPERFSGVLAEVPFVDALTTWMQRVSVSRLVPVSMVNRASPGTMSYDEPKPVG